MIRRADPRWSRTLGQICSTDPSESLPGFLLRLDDANGFAAGEVRRMVRRHRTGPGRTTRPGPLLAVGGVDTAALADLAGVPESDVLALTAAPVLRLLYAGGHHSRSLGQRLSYAVCPRCVRRRRIDRLALFAEIEGCALHGVALMSRCCDRKLDLFSEGRPFHCSRCGRDLADLPVRLLTARERHHVAALSGVYSELLDLGRHAREGEAYPVSELREALRNLLLWRGPTHGRRSELHSRLQKGAPSLPLVVAVLLATHSSALDLLRMLRLRPSAGATRKGMECPNPACAFQRRKAPEPMVHGHERVVFCPACGTRYTATRILFSFDVQPNYPVWRALRNDDRLHVLRARVADLTLQGMHTGRTPSEVLDRAGVPRSWSYRSARAGLLAIISRQALSPAA